MTIWGKIINIHMFCSLYYAIPSGKLPACCGKSPFWMGKSTISMTIFNSYVTNYQRVFPDEIPSESRHNTVTAPSSKNPGHGFAHARGLGDLFQITFNLLVLNVGNGWVAGMIFLHSSCGSFPKIPCVKRTSKSSMSLRFYPQWEMLMFS